MWNCSGSELIGHRVLLNLATVTANENDTLAKLLRRHLPGTSPGQDSIDWSAPGCNDGTGWGGAGCVSRGL